MRVPDNYNPMWHMSPEVKLMAQAESIMRPGKDPSWEGLSKNQQNEALKGSEPILGGEYESREDVQRLLDEHGSIRIWHTHPAVKDFMKNLPEDVEKFELREFQDQGGYQGNPSEPGTVILRKRSMGAPIS